ncbi:hypothetical protein ACFU6M_17780 [Streptomyces bottropensis]|uniref:hypothetical protein n=1 Tax=Streptomyces bottropensis TaxID=42235 RepID=UPI0036AA83F9
MNVRTVWRWLEAAWAEGRMERTSRARLELSDQAWEVQAQAGGNVAALHQPEQLNGVLLADVADQVEVTVDRDDQEQPVQRRALPAGRGRRLPR